MQTPTQRRMCRFDGRCSNKHCTYVHELQRPNREVCRFGEKCSNTACWRFHCMCKVAVAVAPPPPKAVVVAKVGVPDALMLQMIEMLRLKGSTNAAEAEMLRMYDACVEASAKMGKADTNDDDDEVDKAFGEFLDGTDKDAILDDYAAQELDDYEGEDEDDIEEYEDPMTMAF